MSARLSWTRCFSTPWPASLFCLLALLLAGSALAAPKQAARQEHKAPAPENIPRRVLVLYDGGGGLGPDDNMVAQGFQLVFDLHGLVPYYHDIKAASLPDDAQMADTCAIVTTLGQTSVRKPRPYLPWLLKQIKAGKRVMILGYVGVVSGAGADATDTEQLLQALYKELGVAPASSAGLDLRAFRYGRRVKPVADFERALPPLPLATTLLEARSPGVTTYVGLRHPSRPGVEYSAVFVGPAGGFAAENFIYWEEPGGRPRRKWYLDPFVFVEASLSLGDRPAPDVTTINGLRMAFSHVDADGFAGFSRVDKGKSMCAEMLRDRIYKRFNFPVTLSLIVADVDPAIATDPRRAKKAQDVARELFSLPNIEPGSHTYSHPYYWDAQSKTKSRYEDRFPYKIKGYTFSEAQEIDGSIRFISSLSPPSKPCRVLQWSGDCRPTARQIARVDALGLLNINGGDTMYDAHNDSLTSVSPMFRVVGGNYQFFTAGANENVLTNLWKGPFHGYRNIIETFERTETPRRLKPVNIYYHVFSGEYPASVKALEDVYSWVLAQNVAPVFTSQYLEMVRDYPKVRLRRAGPLVYHVEDYGRCLTLRLRADAPEPNLERSENVLGFSRQKQGLYVSLAPGASKAVLSLEPRDAKARPRPYLSEAPGFVSELRAGQDSVSLSYAGFGTGRIRLDGFTPGVALRAQGSALNQPASLKADASGRVDIPGVRTGRLEVAAP